MPSLQDLWKDAGWFTKKASWTTIWDTAIGYNAPDYKGYNTSTLSPKAVFAMFDKVVEFAFAAQIQAEIKEVLAGTKFLCCDEVYECCPRKCKWNKLDDDCEGKCPGELDDADCVEEGCDDDDLKVRCILALLFPTWLYLSAVNEI